MTEAEKRRKEAQGMDSTNDNFACIGKELDKDENCI